MRAVLVISERDNVATALEPLEPGRRIDVGGGFVVATDPIPAGHKVALRPIGAGTAVVKYGSPIGTAVGDIAAGSHVHTHNVASSRGRGDLESPAAPALTRLAEPPDMTPIERTR
jgi:predicted RecA/RadA family phage recombinase